MQYVNLTLTPADNHRLIRLCGQQDEYLRLIEKHYHVEIKNRGHHFQIGGDHPNIETVKDMLTSLYLETEKHHISAEKIQLYLQSDKNYHEDNTTKMSTTIHTKYATIKPKGPNQRRYVENILSHDINFGVGPAGSGKTYLAVACAVQALETQRVARILLVRPAVEAGERLGFLPGDFAQKVDPYLRPLYDALYEMLGFERVQKYIEKNIIEIAPLAYMRGRTLNDAFIILDESQNTTKEQMKMFLTRLGFSSIAVITGDVTQIDLPRGIKSGLIHALDVLKNVKGISLNEFVSKDIVRHPLVQQIVDAYEQHEKQDKTQDVKLNAR